MLQKIAVVSDSNSGISPDEARQLGVALVPMPFYMDEKLYFEGLTCTQADFYRRLAAGAEVSTSQPFPADLSQLWADQLQNAEAVVYIPMSSGLSGSCQVAKALAAEEFAGRVFVVDNHRISITQRQSVLDALTLARRGLSAADIAQTLEAEALNASIYISVNTLKYLKKGGRVTPAAAAIATALNLKPVLQIQGGKLDAFCKVRGMDAACRAMLDAAASDIAGRFAGQRVTVHVAFSGDPAAAEPWRQQVQATWPQFEVVSCALPLSIACHIGDGALALAVIKVL